MYVCFSSRKWWTPWARVTERLVFLWVWRVLLMLSTVHPHPLFPCLSMLGWCGNVHTRSLLLFSGKDSLKSVICSRARLKNEGFLFSVSVAVFPPNTLCRHFLIFPWFSQFGFSASTPAASTLTHPSTSVLWSVVCPASCVALGGAVRLIPPGRKSNLIGE